MLTVDAEVPIEALAIVTVVGAAGKETTAPVTSHKPGGRVMLPRLKTVAVVAAFAVELIIKNSPLLGNGQTLTTVGAVAQVPAVASVNSIFPISLMGAAVEIAEVVYRVVLEEPPEIAVVVQV